MFTGIVEETGHVIARAGSRLVVAAHVTLEGSVLGASVAVNGACLTVVERGPDRLAFDVGPETLRVTALGELGAGDAVNLERPLRLGDFVGGHLVQGHVDGIGTVTSMARHDDTARVGIEWPEGDLGALLVPKGSVAVDGVSLTVASLSERAFEVMLIPHTLERTTLRDLRTGRRVNLEMDMIGKYVVRALEHHQGRGDRR
jgi:riboflavin synthase